MDDLDSMTADELRRVIREIPLKWTAHGNVPIATLTYDQHWEDGPDLTVHKEFWRFANGEIASNNVAAYGRKAFILGAEQQQM
jgi:hypothetical protein